MIATAEKIAFLFLCPGSQFYVFYSAGEKRVLAETLQLERVKILLFSVFVGHVHLNHTVAKWEKDFRLYYHAYFIPFHVSLKSAISFAHGTSYHIQPSATYSISVDDEDITASSDSSQ